MKPEALDSAAVLPFHTRRGHQSLPCVASDTGQLCARPCWALGWEEEAWWVVETEYVLCPQGGGSPIYGKQTHKRQLPWHPVGAATSVELRGVTIAQGSNRVQKMDPSVISKSCCVGVQLCQRVEIQVNNVYYHNVTNLIIMLFFFQISHVLISENGTKL